ncbi:MAG: 5-(carboxyamino)imidazole ribonucleotide mutase [Candidatus Aminicenantes bacterium]|nr:5-(carboxyamino)imidazole ribonucleotide mutase [Candidatus Aminicenantes bacterium]
MDVVLFVGSASDLEVVKEAREIFRAFEISFVVEVTSAHRSPERTTALVRKYEAEGAAVFIAAAGKAAHLAGAVAAQTIRPVIGVPVESGGLGGLDALLSTVQMPKGVPVATMGTGKAGAANAALLAVQILSLGRPDLRERLLESKRKMAAQVGADAEKARSTA